MTLTIQGLQEAQRDNLRQLAAVKPTGALGRAVQMVAIDANRYQVSITDVDTGALRASERIDREGSARWVVYIDPSAKNPRSGRLVSQYAEIENSRGGEHAFADRTFNRADVFVGRAVSYFIGELG